MTKFRFKIIFALAILILIVLFCLGILLGQLFKGFYIETFEERMRKEAKLVNMLIEQQNGFIDSTEEIIGKISDELDSDITIMMDNGDILTSIQSTDVDSEINLNNIKKSILNKKVNYEGFYIMDDDAGYFHYVMRMPQNQHQANIILSIGIDPLNEINQKIWGLLILSLSIAFIVILMLGIKIMTQYTRPIEAATKVANELAKGNYKARAFGDRLEETGMLSHSINILARNLQQMNASQEMQQDRLRTLIENMGSGLILIDSKGYITLINRSFKDTFQVEATDFLYRIYYEAFFHKEVVELIEEIFMTEEKVRRQLNLLLNIERKHFEVYGAPIISNNEQWHGVVVVFHDITELKRLEQMRKDFVANVSHELKTPMTSIKGFSETLLDGAMEDSHLREHFLNIILKESERLQALINDLLDLSKTEQDGFTLNITKVDMKEILNDVVLMLNGKAEEKDISLISKLEDIVFIEGDYDRLKDVFINLINNAIMYTQSGGEVVVSLKSLKDQMKVIVKDTGIGMRQEEIPRIFERFYRIDKARSRNSGGTGLGLAIVKHLVEAHNGYIDVKSEVGIGTCFTVTLNKTLTKN